MVFFNPLDLGIYSVCRLLFQPSTNTLWLSRTRLKNTQSETPLSHFHLLSRSVDWGESRALVDGYLIEVDIALV